MPMACIIVVVCRKHRLAQDLQANHQLTWMNLFK
jgi:hypothetical protein